MCSSRPSRSWAWAMAGGSPAITAHRGLAGRQTAAACRSHRRSPVGPLLAPRQPGTGSKGPPRMAGPGSAPTSPVTACRSAAAATAPWPSTGAGHPPGALTALVRVAGCAGPWRNASRGQGPGRAGPLPGAEPGRLHRFITLAMLALVFLMACAAVGALAATDVQCPARREVGDLGEEPPVRSPAPPRTVALAVPGVPLRGVRRRAGSLLAAFVPVHVRQRRPPSWMSGAGTAR